MEKQEVISEIKGFLKQRPSLTLNALCKEAGVHYRVWYNLLAEEPYQPPVFTAKREVDFKTKIRPVMGRYGHVV